MSTVPSCSIQDLNDEGYIDHHQRDGNYYINDEVDTNIDYHDTYVDDDINDEDDVDYYDREEEEYGDHINDEYHFGYYDREEYYDDIYDEDHIGYYEVTRVFCFYDFSDTFPRVDTTVEVWRVPVGEDDDTEAFEQSFESQPVRFLPASDNSIEGLEKVKVGESEKCTVCLEEMEIGSEATRMPCCHVYHCDCIKTWLMASNLCPLCRFSMPSN